MITPVSAGLVAPRTESVALSADNAADSTTNFFSLLLALFSPGATSVQLSQAPLANASVAVEEPLVARGTGPSTATASDTVLGDDENDPSAPLMPEASASADSMSSEQNLLLSLLAQFLWQQPQIPNRLTAITPEPNSTGGPLSLGEGSLAPLITPNSSVLIVEKGTVLFSDELLAQPKAGGFVSETGKQSENPPAIPLPPSTPMEPSTDVSEKKARNGLLFTGAVDRASQEAELLQTVPQEGVPINRPRNAPAPLELVTLPSGKSAKEAPMPIEMLITSVLPKEKGRDLAQGLPQVLTGAESLGSNGSGPFHAAALTPMVHTPASGNVENWRAVVDQVVNGVVTNIQQESREARIQLDPPELGKLDIQLVVEGERIQAHIVAQSADVGALIQTHLPELKQALQGHRLDLDLVRVDVQSDNGERNPSSRGFHQDERASGRGRNFSREQLADSEAERTLGVTPVLQHGKVSVWA